MPDPVLQQVEHFGDPSTTVNDAFRPVIRYWDRITRPEQVVQSLPLAVATLLDPADCGPAFVGLPQDVQAEAYDFPAASSSARVHEIPRPRAARRRSSGAPPQLLRGARRPLLIAGGGVHYCLAEEELARFAEAHGMPVAETMAGKASLVADHPCSSGRSASPAATRQPARRRGGRRRRRRHPPAGLHHRLVDGVRRRGGG